jgi:MFS family permease
MTEAVAAKPSLRGWGIVWACMIGMIVSGNPIGFSTSSLFLKPVTQELGWSRSDYFLAISVSTLFGAAFAPFVGRMVDRWGVRRVLLPGIVGYGAAVAAMSLLNGSIVQYIGISLMGSMMSMIQGPILYSKAVAQSVDNRRGLALALAMSGSALGAIFIPQWAAILIEGSGWRAAKTGLGLTVVLVALPTVFLFVRPPETARRLRDPNAPPPEGMTLKEAMRRPVFWLLMATFLLSATAIHGATGHLGALVGDRGFPITLAASALSAAGMAQWISRFGSGYLLDRFASPQVGQIWLILAAFGLLLLSMADTPTLVIASAMLIGAGLGAELELLAYYVSRFFGLRAFGQIYGLIFAGFVVGIAAGPLTTARLFDALGDYRVAFWVMAGCMAAACVALAGVGSYVFAARTERS